MKVPTTLTTLVLPVVLAQNGSLGVEGPTPFVGKGIVGMYDIDDGRYLGCMTRSGQFTVDQALCAAVTGRAVYSGNEVQISTSSGGCETNIELFCQGDTFTFERVPLGYGTRIFYGDLYLTYAADNGVWPTGSEAVTVHIYYSLSTGPFFQLGWNATSS